MTPFASIGEISVAFQNVCVFFCTQTPKPPDIKEIYGVSAHEINEFGNDE